MEEFHIWHLKTSHLTKQADLGGNASEKCGSWLSRILAGSFVIFLSTSMKNCHDDCLQITYSFLAALQNFENRLSASSCLSALLSA
jgi:hypothetical protein